jgi:hypothetical protein
LGSSLVPVTTLVVVNTVVQPFVGWREGLTVNEEAKLQVQTVMKADIVVTCSDLTVKLDEHVSMCQKTNNNMTVAIHSATVLLGKYRVLPSSLSLREYLLVERGAKGIASSRAVVQLARVALIERKIL